METIEVPSINERSPIKSAIQLMNESQSAAIIVVFDELKILFPSRYVFEGYGTDKLEYCSELDRDKGFPILDVDTLGIDMPKRQDFSERDPSTSTLKSAMDREKAKFAIRVTATKSVSRKLSVVARTNDYLQLIAGLHPICVCSGPGRHLEDDTEGLDGKPCKVCGFPYVCTTSL